MGKDEEETLTARGKKKKKEKKGGGIWKGGILRVYRKHKQRRGKRRFQASTQRVKCWTKIPLMTFWNYNFTTDGGPNGLGSARPRRRGKLRDNVAVCYWVGEVFLKLKKEQRRSRIQYKTMEFSHRAFPNLSFLSCSASK